MYYSLRSTAANGSCVYYSLRSVAADWNGSLRSTAANGSCVYYSLRSVAADWNGSLRSVAADWNGSLRSVAADWGGLYTLGVRNSIGGERRCNLEAPRGCPSAAPVLWLPPRSLRPRPLRCSDLTRSSLPPAPPVRCAHSPRPDGTFSISWFDGRIRPFRC